MTILQHFLYYSGIVLWALMVVFNIKVIMLLVERAKAQKKYTGELVKIADDLGIPILKRDLSQKEIETIGNEYIRRLRQDTDIQ